MKYDQRKIKRVSVSSKRQLTIPKEYFDTLEMETEVFVELIGNRLVIKPADSGREDFSEEILEDIVREGFEGYELVKEFKERKTQVKPALDKLINETEKQAFTTIEDLFGDDKNE